MFKLTKHIFLFLKTPHLIHVGSVGSAAKSINESSLNLSSYESEPQANKIQYERNIKRSVPTSVEEYKNLSSLEPFQPESPHILKVSILGEPNVGKSTLTNTLVKWKVCAVSRKVHTTRTKATAILVDENKQIVFLDTPGFVTPEHSKKHKLEASFVMDPLRSVREANLIAVVVDVSDRYTNNRINPSVLEVLEDFKEKPSILILNKIDAMKSKERLLSCVQILTQGIVDCKVGASYKNKLDFKDLSIQDIFEKTNKQLLGDHDDVSASNEQLSTENIEEKRGWPLFSRVFMVSALKNDGVDDLRQYLLGKAQPGEWTYHNATVTDQHPYQIAIMTVRENLLEYLPNEIPYIVDLKISKWEILPSGSPRIVIKIACANSRHKRFVIGPAGKHIAACCEKSRLAMREAFRKDIVLKLAVV